MSRNDTIRGVPVAVVGGAGFLGSHLVDHLLNDRQCKVIVIDNLVAGRREFIHKDAFFWHGDITHSEIALRNLFSDYSIQYVFSYAAHPYIPDSFARPLHTINSNMIGAVNVINAAQDAGVRAILQVSSAEIYGGCNSKEYPNIHPMFKKSNEDSPVEPHSTYGVAKAAVDNYVQVRWREAKTPCIALRQFNCIGERETHPYIVPEIIGQLAKQSPVVGGVKNGAKISLGNNSYRDFQYAGDAVRMATELLEKGNFGEVYNMGSEEGIRMYDLAQLTGKLIGFEDVWVEPDSARMRPWEIWHLQSDNTKLYEVIDYRPQTSFEDALRKTIQWYNDNGRKWSWE